MIAVIIKTKITDNVIITIFAQSGTLFLSVFFVVGFLAFLSGSTSAFLEVVSVLSNFASTFFETASAFSKTASAFFNSAFAIFSASFFGITFKSTSFETASAFSTEFLTSEKSCTAICFLL